MTTIEEKAREQATNAFHSDGHLEVDNGTPVNHVQDDTYDVQVWVWVSNEDADIQSNDDHSEEEREHRYLNAALNDAVYTEAEFRDDAEVSLGDDDGSYVSGWVTLGVDLTGNEESEAA